MKYLLILTFLALCAGAIFVLYKPNSASTLSKIQASGFENAALEGEDNILLDEDGFSKLYGVLGAKLRGISIEKAQLIGEVLGSGEVSISGWNGNISPQANIKIAALEINLSTPLGVVLITGKTNISPKKIEASLRTNQANLSLYANVTAQRSIDEKWSADINAERGHIVMHGVRLSRLSGTITIDEGTIFAEFAAGGMRIGALPFRDASGAFNNGELLLQARALGNSEIELSLTNAHGNIYAPDAGALTTWLRSNNFDGDLPNWPQGAINVDFNLTKDGKIIF